MIMTYLKYTMQTVEMFLFCNTIQGKYCSSVVHQVSDNMDQDSLRNQSKISKID